MLQTVRVRGRKCIGRDKLIGERAKRARRYLVMLMETRDIYIQVKKKAFKINAKMKM